MATDKAIAEFIAAQSGYAGVVRINPMFGEYCLYCDDKVVGFICDNRLLLKPTAASEMMLPDAEFGRPYPEAKDYVLVPEDMWEDRAELSQLIRATAAELPLPKKRKKKQ